MVGSINSLMNMEMMLYGGLSGLNPNCPSYVNGYRAGGYGYYNPAFTSTYNNPYTNPYNAAQVSTAVNNPYRTQIENTYQIPQTGLGPNFGKGDMDKVADWYLKQSAGEETLLGAASGALTFAAFENPQNVKHFINAFKGMREADKALSLSIPEIAEFAKKYPRQYQEAYSQYQALARNTHSKWGFLGGGAFQKRFEDKSLTQARKYMDNIADAVKSGDLEKVAKATQEGKAARGMDGYIISAWNKITGGKNLTPDERVAKKASQIAKGVKEAKSFSFFGAAAKEFKGWAIFELAIEGITKVIPAFMQGGKKSGVTQIKQSTVKAGASAAGWAVGRAAGSFIGAKVGAAVGSLICPGVGTAVGAIVGLGCGLIGSHLATKAVKKWVIPQDECERLQAEKLKNTPEGQQELLGAVIQQAQEGKELPPEILSATERIMSQYKA